MHAKKARYYVRFAHLEIHVETFLLRPPLFATLDHSVLADNQSAQPVTQEHFPLTRVLLDAATAQLAVIALREQLVRKLS